MPTVRVIAPSRLHFGLSAFGEGPHAYGGVGAMIEGPGLEITVRDAESFSVAGPLAKRAEGFAQKIASGLADDRPLACAVEVVAAPPEHAGLGLGTQLGLAVAAGIDAWLHGAARPATDLAPMVGRGRRSAVGTHGFDLGGLIVDGGQASPGALGRLERRVAMPDAWRMLLVTPPASPGLSGQPESAAFGRLPPIPPRVTEQLRSQAASMADAAAAGDFDRFAATLGAYGRRAGECFDSVQGGPFASPAIEALVDQLAGLGAAGAGQSSWGPTVFVPARSPEHAEELAAALRQGARAEHDEAEQSAQPAPPIIVTRFNNTGAAISVDG